MNSFALSMACFQAGVYQWESSVFTR